MNNLQIYKVTMPLYLAMSVLGFLALIFNEVLIIPAFLLAFPTLIIGGYEYEKHSNKVGGRT